MKIFIQAPRGCPVAPETGSFLAGPQPSCVAVVQSAVAPWRRGRGARRRRSARGHGGAGRLGAAAVVRGPGPGSGQRLFGGSAAGQRGGEAHGGPEQPLGQGDGRGGPGAPGRRLHITSQLFRSGPGAGTGVAAGAPRRAGERREGPERPHTGSLRGPGVPGEAGAARGS